jgi:hypothetical protein
MRVDLLKAVRDADLHDLPKGRPHVLAMLVWRAEDDGTWLGSQLRLAVDADCSDDQVWRHLRALAAAKLVTATPRYFAGHTGWNIYRINVAQLIAREIIPEERERREHSRRGQARVGAVEQAHVGAVEQAHVGAVMTEDLSQDSYDDLPNAGASDFVDAPMGGKGRSRGFPRSDYAPSDRLCRTRVQRLRCVRR